MGVSQPPVGGQCKDGFSPCGKGDALRCHDLSQSKDNCGACGHACAPGIACQAGTCQQYRCKGALSFVTLFKSTGDAQALGDFDGDGILDLVGASEENAPMSLLYGAGDGTFPTHQVIDSASRLGRHALAADVDGDGFLDLTSIAGDAITDTPTYPVNAVTVRRGSGSRSTPFGEATVYPTSDTTFSLLLADFDADGRLDLVAGLRQVLEYWRGQDGGRFEHQATLGSVSQESMVDPPYTEGPLAMDWNGDGTLDLVYKVRANLHFRLGRGDGSFDPDVACALAMGVVGDLDHDNRPDLISGSNLLLGIDGCHASKIVPLPDWPKQGGVALADFNGDGNLDIVANSDIDVTVRVGDGQGGIVKSLSMPAPEVRPSGIIGKFLSGDLNRDGKLDIVFDWDGLWGVFLNTCQ
jgi:hypothetical protein